MSFPGVREPGMLNNDYTGTWETLRLFHEQVLFRKVHESMANNRSKGRMPNGTQGVGSLHSTKETDVMSAEGRRLHVTDLGRGHIF